MPELESALVTLALAAILLPPVVAAWRTRSSAVRLGAVAAWIAAAGVIAWAGSVYPRTPVTVRTAELRPLELATDGHVSSAACQACHPGEYQTWWSSFHRTMTQAASPQTILAPWDGVRVVARGVPYLFDRRGDEYWVEMDDPDWGGAGTPERVWKQIVQVTGAHHWQFYWYPSGESRKLSLLLCAYRVCADPSDGGRRDAPGARWMPLDGCCVSPPDGGQESGSGRWTRTCNKCHATHARPRWRSEHEMDTHVTELGIACEACHGPGGEHAELNRDPRRRYALHGRDDADESIVNPRRLPHDRASQVCGNCHGVTEFRSAEERIEWAESGYRYRPGDDLEATRELVRDAPADKFWSDGMIRVSGREFSGLETTPCYRAGQMSCLSCHSMHKAADDPRPIEQWRDDQLHPGMDGNLACTQCHATYAEPQALADHSRHAPGSSGSECYNCHMPYTTYGLLKGIRTHGLDVPDVATTLATGRPNACNLCHLDRTLAWTAEQLESWYGRVAPEMPRDERTVAASLLWALRGDAGQRALVAWAMGWDPARRVSGTDWMVPHLVMLMLDPYHAVRYIAEQTSRKHHEFAGLRYEFMDSDDQRRVRLGPLFDDWLRSSPRQLRQDRTALLFDEQGLFDQQRASRLLAENENVPITLNE